MRSHAPSRFARSAVDLLRESRDLERLGLARADLHPVEVEVIQT